MHSPTDKAVAAAEAGDFENASQIFADALKLDPSNAALHEQHAQCLLELDECEAAANAAQAAIALKPSVGIVGGVQLKELPQTQLEASTDPLLGTLAPQTVA